MFFGGIIRESKTSNSDQIRDNEHFLLSSQHMRFIKLVLLIVTKKK